MVLFTLVASRTGNGLHPRCGDRGRESGAGDPDLPPPERYKQRMERGKGACPPQCGGRATLAVIGRGSSVPKQDTAGGKRFCKDRNATSCAVTATISSTRARGRAGRTGLSTRRMLSERGSGEREHDGAFSGEVQKCAPEDLREALVGGAPRGGDGAASSHEGVAR